jgi:hypothetical protein
LLDVQIVGEAEGQEALFWLRGLGPIVDDRLGLHLSDCENSGGFYCYEHSQIVNLALLAFRIEQKSWRLVAVANLTTGANDGHRVEMDVRLAVVERIEGFYG